MSVAWSTVIAATLLSGAATWGLTPWIRGALWRRGIIDYPTARSSHAMVTPRGGGMACLAGLTLGSALIAWIGEPIPWVPLVAVAGIALVGLVDDRRGLSPAPRLAAQALCGAVIGGSVGGPVLAVIGAAVSMCIINAVNFMDGIDGITALTMAVVGAAAVVSGMARDSAGGADDLTLTQDLVLVGALTVGAAVGFLPHNLSRDKIFLGDIGSYLFGGLSTLLVVLAAAPTLGTWQPAPAVAAALLPYAADTAVTAVRRLRRGESLTTPHREHVYQQLAFGRAHVRVSGFVSFVAAALVASWLWLPVPLAIAVSALLLVTFTTSPRWAHQILPLDRQTVRT